ncbi:hypothetical protein LSTR_LSTR015707 [Laodelphax striatellus]|uniref:Uncharacterized protein n=1 Tax=Laodelphax striatellus TaxID=195883 RepID=A0A482XEC9_LAOST|nr:hypothetical protein LSTR_LSTR015707 [Laodelphax striatellus]
MVTRVIKSRTIEGRSLKEACGVVMEINPRRNNNSCPMFRAQFSFQESSDNDILTNETVSDAILFCHEIIFSTKLGEIHSTISINVTKEDIFKSFYERFRSVESADQLNPVSSALSHFIRSSVARHWRRQMPAAVRVDSYWMRWSQAGRAVAFSFKLRSRSSFPSIIRFPLAACFFAARQRQIGARIKRTIAARSLAARRLHFASSDTSFILILITQPHFLHSSTSFTHPSVSE